MQTHQPFAPRASQLRAAHWTGVFAVSALVAACGGGGDDPAPAPVVANQLYTQTNEASNAVVHFTRQSDGTLLRKESTATGGAGTNGVGTNGATAPDSLAGQHSLIIDAASRNVFVVNGGDDSISVMTIDQGSGALMLKRRTPTPAGHIPNSLALSKGVLYVTFLGGSQQLAAYKLQDDGSLSQIAGYGLAALGNLSGAVAPTQVVPSPDGNFVVVSAGTATNAVMSFPVKADGSLGAPVTNTAQIATPFAGAFVARTGEAPAYLSTGISSISLSSYSFSSAGALARTSQVVAAGVAAPCWLAVTPDGKFAFVGNGSGAVSSYAIGSGSTLTLVNSVAAQEPSAITGVNSVAADSWISPDGKFFYVAYLGDDKLVAYSIGSDGSLKKLGENVVGTSTRLSLQGLAGV